MPKAACVIPTRNGREMLERLLASIARQTVQLDVLVVDSSSSDGTALMARTAGANVTVIPVEEFNHGGTRQLMVDQNPDYDVYVFLTQDAYLETEDAIAEILVPFDDPQVGAVCGRQLPHHDASVLARHARTFNYPDTSRMASRADIPRLGLRAAFMSNSFAAYRREALLGVGGFPRNVILSEDMYVAAKMLLKGWKVGYVASAMCRHSHNYSLLEEFRRYFDIGVFHAREAWLRDEFSHAEGEGMRFIKSELRAMGLSHLHLWPGAFVRNFLKFVGYRLGLAERSIPIPWKRRLSMHRGFWDSIHGNGFCKNEPMGS